MSFSLRSRRIALLAAGLAAAPKFDDLKKEHKSTTEAVEMIGGAKGTLIYRLPYGKVAVDVDTNPNTRNSKVMLDWEFSRKKFPLTQLGGLNGEASVLGSINPGYVNSRLDLGVGLGGESWAGKLTGSALYVPPLPNSSPRPMFILDGLFQWNGFSMEASWENYGRWALAFCSSIDPSLVVGTKVTSESSQTTCDLMARVLKRSHDDPECGDIWTVALGVPSSLSLAKLSLFPIELTATRQESNMLRYSTNLKISSNYQSEWTFGVHYHHPLFEYAVRLEDWTILGVGLNYNLLGSTQPKSLFGLSALGGKRADEDEEEESLKLHVSMALTLFHKPVSSLFGVGLTYKV